VKSKASLTGQYLSRKKRVEIPHRRKVDLVTMPRLDLKHAALHNLKDLAVQIPLDRFVCVTGVSGSGKTTLVREVVLPALEMRLRSRSADFKSRSVKAEDKSEADEEQLAIGHRPSAILNGWQHVDRVVLVDQSILGKTPRSNPAVISAHLMTSANCLRNRKPHASAG